MKRMLWLALILTWAAIGSALYYVGKYGGVYDTRKDLGTVNGKSVFLSDLMEVYALTRQENLSEVILRETVRQQAETAGIPFDKSNRRSVALTLAKILVSRLSPQDRKRMEAGRKQQTTLYTIHAIPCPEVDLEYLKTIIADEPFEMVAIRYDNDPDRTKWQELARSEIEGKYGTSAVQAIASLKPQQYSPPIRQGRGYLFLGLREKTPAMTGSLESYLLQSQGWKQLRSWVRAGDTQFPYFAYTERDLEIVFKMYVKSLNGGD